MPHAIFRSVAAFAAERTVVDFVETPVINEYQPWVTVDILQMTEAPENQGF
jgi:hypothetical protein